MSTEDKIRNQLATNPILLYMKGTPDDPKCGFSRNAVNALKTLGASYSFVNVLEAPFIREKLPSISDWPTYPQLFIKGELVGGSDVICEMADDGSLKPMLDTAGS
ncbi:MAG: Grx4 family monothiol glutaredoxin [Neptuniibacter sp.]